MKENQHRYKLAEFQLLQLPSRGSGNPDVSKIFPGQVPGQP